MSFISRNHPQQVGVRGADDTVDDRWTPLHLWIPWNDRWDFTLDAAASDANHLCDRYCTLQRSGLEEPWVGERVWCNPPYSDMASWVIKTWDEMNSGCELVVMLAPANRTEQRWWQEHIEPYRDRGGTLSTEFLPRRINFGSRDNLGAWSASSAPFGCVLLIWQNKDAAGGVSSAPRFARATSVGNDEGPASRGSSAQRKSASSDRWRGRGV